MPNANTHARTYTHTRTHTQHTHLHVILTEAGPEPASLSSYEQIPRFQKGEHMEGQLRREGGTEGGREGGREGASKIDSKQTEQHNHSSLPNYMNIRAHDWTE